jgi:hypothetical protein
VTCCAIAAEAMSRPPARNTNTNFLTIYDDSFPDTIVR